MANTPSSNTPPGAPNPANSRLTERIACAGLQVDSELFNLVEQEILPGTGIDSGDFWQQLDTLVHELGPVNRALLAKREQLQQQINQWHRDHPGVPDPASYKQFLLDIGYLVAEGDDFAITTEQVEPEISQQAGPQLVVPVSNARFALNAANARWGSLYDALYGTDIIPETAGVERGSAYNPQRGASVISFGRNFLNQTFPLSKGSHSDVSTYTIHQNTLHINLTDGSSSALAEPQQLAGFQGQADAPTAILLRHHNLHCEIQLDREHHIGKTDTAGIKDILMEAALTTIIDCEDSVAAVDAEDKCQGYRNWLGLMKGDLSEAMEKNGRSLTRKLSPDRIYQTAGPSASTGKPLVLKGRSLLFVRNVGHLMTNPAILDREGREIPEGILDGMITALAAIHDLKGNGRLGEASIRNSTANSINIVKPKMHGPEEVAFSNTLFDRIEDALGLDRYTLKIGIMDEERRTSVNLKACIHAARNRVVFINTGFLDRTGDEIHTSMEAGPFAPKAQLKTMPWIGAYEDQNVDLGLACQFQGKAQIGKGMWPEPDNMAKMMAAKIAHPMAGANTAWVPSPTAATLHALHYHQVNVLARQSELMTRKCASVEDILRIPLLAADQVPDAQQIQLELENNCQGILGYVVRWVDQGVGCSKVPDINNVGLMEDRATLRISSQHIANWLRHGLCSEQQVEQTLRKMALVVDEQNAGDPAYRPMAANIDDNIAFNAARDLIIAGTIQPSGYTEPLLHKARQKAKQRS